ncbi:cyclase family protein [Stackebrandtia soli]|uniref:cyclase family protein n=1 Tax=Stackebrandtia soli TaxID=1892856 RepID=UPI0039E9302C
MGALNHLDAAQVLRGVAAVEKGSVFTLQRRVGDPDDEMTPHGRAPARHTVHQDQRTYATGAARPVPGGLEYADDTIDMYLQGTTHVDALGHVWYDGMIWNGQPAESTNDGLDFASVLPISERGIVGRGVLLDMARHRGKESLERGETFGVSDLLECAHAQGIEIERGDIVLIRTGWLTGSIPSVELDEPGLEFHPDLVRWFDEFAIPCLVGDTFANEATHHSAGCDFVLHGALVRNLGIVFVELASLDELAADCAADRRYAFLYVAAPLKIAHATGSPVNPIAIK